MMTESQFSLSWSAHRSNICTGLSSLQQNSEFVDMTLAADGHHVKVHQVIMALASPYIKDLISTAQCPHPVIFLNKISYVTLSAILEYIYTGEVLIPVNNLSELIEAGKELHIKGLEDMNFSHMQTSSVKAQIAKPKQKIVYEQDVVKEEQQATSDECCYFEIADRDGGKYMIYGDPSDNIQTSNREHVEEVLLEDQTFDESMQAQDEDMQADFAQDISSQDVVIQCTTTETNNDYEAKLEVIPKHISSKAQVIANKKSLNPSDCGVMQYTVSNQGSLQLILNRFVYYLKHSKRSGARQWRCVDYLGHSRCPAIVVTNEDVVVQRISAHTHSFHDKRILKKVQAGAVFSAINEAVLQGNAKKNAKETAQTTEPQSE